MEVPDTALDEPLLQHRKQDIRAQQQTLDWGCALNLAKVITGAGMMAIPRAFLQIGWLPGTIMLLGVALLTFFTLVVLVQASAATQASTYGELVCRTCGVGMMRLLQLAVLLFCFGFSVVYLVSVPHPSVNTSTHHMAPNFSAGLIGPACLAVCSASTTWHWFEAQ